MKKIDLTGSRLAGGNPLTPREENDFYATPPSSVEDLLNNYKIEGNSFYEPCVGQGHISKVLKQHFPNAKIVETDLIYRGVGIGDVDFVKTDVLSNVLGNKKVDWVITNPPFKYAKEFIQKSLDITNKGVAMFLKISFLETTSRKEFLQNSPLKYVYVFSKRQNPMKEGLELNPLTGKKWSSTICFAWFIWEHGYTGEPVIRWI
jgi:hypothetical protein